MEISLSSTIGESFAGHAERNPQALAIMCPGIEPLTFGDLGRHISRIGAQLKAAGVGTKSRVAVVLPRGPEAALVSLAICSVAIVLPINPSLTAPELEAELEKIRADALIVPAGVGTPAWARKAGGLFEVTRVTRSFDEIDLKALAPVARRSETNEPITSKSVLAVVRTSGTTGTA